MKYLEYYTQIDYPLPKVDMAAIPDFAAGIYFRWWLKGRFDCISFSTYYLTGAMENWGHINFKYEIEL